MQYQIIKKANSKCYYCLEDINYCVKFNCGCYNYLHIGCINDNIFTKCFICKKSINKDEFLSSNHNHYSNNHNNYSNNLFLTNFVINKIKLGYFLNELTIFTIGNKNLLSLIFYFFVCMIFIFIVIIPLMLIDFVLEKINSIIKLI